MTEDIGNYIPAKQAAAEAGIVYSTFIRQIEKKKIAAKKVGWALLVHIDEVARLKVEQGNKNANNKIVG